MNQGISLRAMAAEATEAVIDVVGVIGWEVGFQQIRQIVTALPSTVTRVVFDIYSPGGDVWDGNAMIHEIGQMPQETVARVRVAASMATLIAVACQKREMSVNGRWLVHNPWTATQGDAAEFEKRAKELRDAQNEAAAFYAKRTGQSTESMLKLMDEERWLTAAEAKDFGFVQTVCDPFEVAAFAPVRAALVADGKWPQALVELPAGPKQEDATNAHADTAGTEGSSEPATLATADAPPADELRIAAQDFADALKAEYARGRAEGLEDGRAAAVAAVASDTQAQVDALRTRLAKSEETCRALQSKADTQTAQMAQHLRTADERAKALGAEIIVLSERLKKNLAGALAWEPAVETWEDALRACGGEYAKAATQYPELLRQYRAEYRRNGRK